MKLHTEKELLLYNQHQAFRLKQLYLKSPNMFYEVANYLPFSVHFNQRQTLGLLYSNKVLGEWINSEEYDTKGFAFIKKISDPFFLKRSVQKIKLFDKTNDAYQVCSHMQKIKFRGNNMSLYLTNKMILDDGKYLNLGFKLSDLGKCGGLLEEIISEVAYKQENWQKIQSLTKQEKNILIQLSRGLSNEKISEHLIISYHTVRTHRKNLYKKLDIQNFKDLMSYAQAFELL